MIKKRKEASALIQARMELYQMGLLVKKLNDDGTVAMRQGQIVWTPAEGATPAELAFWKLEQGG
jgi:hypothetical protein